MLFRSPDQGGASGGTTTATNPPTAKPAAAKAPEPEGKTHEERLASATQIIERLHSEAQAATDLRAENTRLQGENTRLQQQFDSVTGEATAAKADVTRLQGELTTEQNAHKDTTTRLGTEQKNVTRLEGLCGLKGIDTSAAVTLPANTGGAGASDPLAELQKQFAAENDPDKKADLAAKITELRDAKK
jgi:hypothetical protein